MNITKVQKDKKYRPILVLGILCLLMGLIAGCSSQQSGKNSQAPDKTAGQSAKPLSTAGTDNSVQIKAQKEKTEEEAISVELSIPQISGMKSQNLQAALNRKLAAETLNLKKQTVEDARAYYKETRESGDHFMPYEFVSSYSIQFNGNGILSITVENYRYSGGAHGLTDIIPYNFDLKTGQELALADLFPSGFDYPSIIDKQVRQEIATRPEEFFEGSEGFQGIGDQRPYYIEPGNIVVYFGQYEIAPYSSGIPEFAIPVTLFGDNIDSRLRKE